MESRNTIKFMNRDLEREFPNIHDMALQLKNNGHQVHLSSTDTSLAEMPYVIDIEDQSYFYQDKSDLYFDIKEIQRIFVINRIIVKLKNTL